MAEITTYPASIVAAFNKVTVASDSDYGDLTVSWDDDGAKRACSLAREALNGEKIFEIQSILQSILGVGSTEERLILAGVGILLQFFTILSKEVAIEGSNFMAVNAALRKGELEENDLLLWGKDGVLSERPRSADNVITIPRYEGYPTGICVQMREAYSEVENEYLYWQPVSLNFSSDQEDNERTVRLYRNYTEAYVEVPAGAGVTIEKISLDDETEGYAEYKITRTTYTPAGVTPTVTLKAVGQSLTADLQITFEDEDAQAWLGASSITFECGEATKTIAVKTNASLVKWTLELAETYVYADVYSGTGPATVIITKTKEPTSDQKIPLTLRTTATGEETTAYVNLTACSQTPYVKISNDYYHFETTGQTTILVQSSGSWHLSGSYNTSYISVDRTSGNDGDEITVTCIKRPELDPVDAYIYVVLDADESYRAEFNYYISPDVPSASISYPSGVYFNVDTAVVDRQEHSITIPISTNGGCYSARIGGGYWYNANGYGISKLVLNGTTLTAGGSVSLNPNTDYNMEISYYPYRTSEPTPYGYYFGILLEFTVEARNYNGTVNSSQEIQVYTSNYESGPLD